jgi:hypothetical protein
MMGLSTEPAIRPLIPRSTMWLVSRTLELMLSKALVAFEAHRYQQNHSYLDSVSVPTPSGYYLLMPLKADSSNLIGGDHWPSTSTKHCLWSEWVTWWELNFVL